MATNSNTTTDTTRKRVVKVHVPQDSQSVKTEEFPAMGNSSTTRDAAPQNQGVRAKKSPGKDGGINVPVQLWRKEMTKRSNRLFSWIRSLIMTKPKND